MATVSISSICRDPPPLRSASLDAYRCRLLSLATLRPHLPAAIDVPAGPSRHRDREARPGTLARNSARSLRVQQLLSFLWNLLLVHTVGVTRTVTYNVPSWSIIAEFYIYVVFALIAAALVALARPCCFGQANTLSSTLRTTLASSAAWRDSSSASSPTSSTSVCPVARARRAQSGCAICGSGLGRQSVDV